jgi:DNA-binding Xre family transcriptional regulator
LTRTQDGRIFQAMSKKNISRQLCVRLDQVLKDRGISQAQAAKQTGISKNGISILCGEPRLIRMDTLTLLCLGLGVQPAELIVWGDHVED